MREWAWNPCSHLAAVQGSGTFSLLPIILPYMLCALLIESAVRGDLHLCGHLAALQETEILVLEEAGRCRERPKHR
jgi:hypothetical protein